MDPLDKQIHKDDFRLRLLVTDGCNKGCYHCLNDFQLKPTNRPKFLDPTVAKEIIKTYCLFMGSKAQVEISGGEPGIYPHLKEILTYAKKFNAFVKVNTNVMALNWDIKELVDCWHVGVTEYNLFLSRDIKEVNGRAQIVVTDKNVGYARDMAALYGLDDVPVKLFVDFFAFGGLKRRLVKAILTAIDEYPSFDITTRFTGVQENRGAWCSGCDKKCITLKALWVFPDGKVSPCPQGVIPRKIFDPGDIELVRLGHLKEE